MVIGLALMGLSACEPELLELHGHVETLEYQGETCWIFVDKDHNKYELITPSTQVLRENVQMRIRAKKVEIKTLCDLPTVIDAVEYKYDFEKDRR